MRISLSARSRLALLYTALVFAAGAALAGLTYLLVRRSLDRRPVMLADFRSPDAATPSPLNRTEALGAIERLRADTLTQLSTQSLIALAVVTTLAAALGWLIAGRILRPIRAISATAQRLSAENLSERVPVTTPADELANLAETVNGMLARIQTGVVDRDRLLRSQRMFVANAAHELRTPLTTMRTAIDVTLDGRPGTDELLTMARDIRTAVDHSQRTLDGLLTLARSQTGPSRREGVDLADLVGEIATSATQRAAAQQVELRTNLLAAPIVGDPTLLDRMIANLVDNAIRYNQPGGHVTITTDHADSHTMLHIANTGRPVDPDQADRLFEPFVRGSASARGDGVGLGLSIVHAIASAHDGDISCLARPGGGLDISIRFTNPMPGYAGQQT